MKRDKLSPWIDLIKWVDSEAFLTNAAQSCFSNLVSNYLLHRHRGLRNSATELPPVQVVIFVHEDSAASPDQFDSCTE